MRIAPDLSAYRYGPDQQSLAFLVCVDRQTAELSQLAFAQIDRLYP